VFVFVENIVVEGHFWLYERWWWLRSLRGNRKTFDLSCSILWFP
jgi:hypothetical protein